MAAQVYVFESFRLDVRERQLLCNGSIIPVRGKVFDTLCALVRHPGRLLRKRELMQAIWPDTVVEENNLEHNLCVLRKILGQSKKDKRFIETVPRQGYRFVASVNIPDEPLPAGFPFPVAVDAASGMGVRAFAPAAYRKATEAEGDSLSYCGLA